MNPALRELTTLRVGGVPRAYISVRSLEDVERVRSVALEQGLSVAMLGGGSNVLAREGELNIALAHMQITGIDFFDHGDMCSVAVGAGVSWDLFVEATVRRGLWGIENLSGIPGTVGAAPIQNIGAYGVEIKDALTSLLAMDMETGKVQEFEKKCV